MARRQAGDAGGRDLLASRRSRSTTRSYSAYYRHVVKAEKTGEREVTFTFDAPGNRELPQIVGQLNVLPKHWWEGTDASGKKRDIARDHARAAARLRRLPDQGVRRRPHHRATSACKDYWGKDLNVNIGRDNFDEIRYEYFRDSTVALEAFKADAIDWRTENRAKNWATAYDFPAVKDKRVVLENSRSARRGVMQALRASTSRRDKFKDPRVRLALQLRVRFRGDEQAAVLRPV